MFYYFLIVLKLIIFFVQVGKQLFQKHAIPNYLLQIRFAKLGKYLHQTDEAFCDSNEAGQDKQKPCD